MIRLLMLLIVGDWHRHMWDIHKEIRLFDAPGDTLSSGTDYILRCRECGAIKVKCA